MRYLLEINDWHRSRTPEAQVAIVRSLQRSILPQFERELGSGRQIMCLYLPLHLTARVHIMDGSEATEAPTVQVKYYNAEGKEVQPEDMNLEGRR